MNQDFSKLIFNLAFQISLRDAFFDGFNFILRIAFKAVFHVDRELELVIQDVLHAEETEEIKKLKVSFLFLFLILLFVFDRIIWLECVEQFAGGPQKERPIGHF